MIFGISYSDNNYMYKKKSWKPEQKQGAYNKMFMDMFCHIEYNIIVPFYNWNNSAATSIPMGMVLLLSKYLEHKQ